MVYMCACSSSLLEDKCAALVDAASRALAAVLVKDGRPDANLRRLRRLDRFILYEGCDLLLKV